SAGCRREGAPGAPRPGDRQVLPGGAEGAGGAAVGHRTRTEDPRHLLRADDDLCPDLAKPGAEDHRGGAGVRTDDELLSMTMETFLSPEERRRKHQLEDRRHHEAEVH